MRVNLTTGIYEGSHKGATDGWRILCEQERLPLPAENLRENAVLLCEGETPPWLPEYMQAGGVAVVTGASPSSLCIETAFAGTASLEYITLFEPEDEPVRIQCAVNLFEGEGLGKLSLHEKRITKLGLCPDEFPAVLYREVGRGGCFYSGVPFSSLICTLGDTLRRTDSFSDFTERVTAVDKHLLLRAMRSLLARAFAKRSLPYVRLSYYPGSYESAFALRVDVDGIFGDSLGLLSRAAAQCGIKTSFYVNQKMCEPEQERLFEIDDMHDIGNHAVLHNLYTGQEDNAKNVAECREWMNKIGLRNGPWFVAPRGMWNYNLNRALEREGYTYTSDFGFCIHGLPFFPYFRGERMGVKQIPVNPFSAERACAKAQEAGLPMPSADDVADYFCRSVREQFALGMPSILYSHPYRFGAMAATVLPRVKALLDSLNIWQTTLPALSEWWSLRDSVRYSAQFNCQTGNVNITGEIPDAVRVDVSGHPQAEE